MAKSIPGKDQDSMRTRLVSILEDLDCDAKFITLTVEYGLIASNMQNQIMVGTTLFYFNMYNSFIFCCMEII